MEWLRANWQALASAGALIAAGFLTFRSTLAVYGHIFFPARAVRNSLIKALVMVALLFLLFAIPHWIAQWLLPEGRIQSLSLVVSFLLLDFVWKESGRLLDRLLIGPLA